MNEVINDAIVHFIIGASPVVTIFVYIILLHNYYTLTQEEKDEIGSDLVLLFFLLPVLYGIIMAILYICLGSIPRKTSNGIYLRFIISGALASVVVSLLCHYCSTSYNALMKIEDVAMFHVLVFVFYIVFFYTVGQWLRAQLIYGPTPTKSSSSGGSMAHSSSAHPSTPSHPIESLSVPASQQGSQGTPLYHTPPRVDSLKKFELMKKLNEIKK